MYVCKKNKNAAEGKAGEITTGMGIVRENVNFCGDETDFPWRKTVVCGEKKLGVQKTGNTKLSSAPKTP